MKKQGKWINKLFLFVLLLLMGGAAWYFIYGQNKLKPKNEIPEKMLSKAERRDIETKLLLTGEVAPAFSVAIKSEISGKIKTLHMETGQFIKKGELMVTIDPKDLLTERTGAETEVDGTRLEVEKKRGNYERAKSLFEEKLISKEVYANLESDLRIAENALIRSQARLQAVDDKLSKTRIVAPASGTVLDIPVTEGQVVVGATSVNNGTTLATFADLGRLLINSHINQMDINSVKSGDILNIEMGEGPESVPAVIKFIAPVASVKNNIKGFEVEAEIQKNDPRIRPGMSLSLELPVAKSAKTISVPISAVFTDNDEKVVYVRSGGQTYKRTVKVGLANFDYAEILDGVREGEQILLVKPQNVTNPS
ncbi:MAG: efflux RND transporter periplasmic adaptor subunit [Chthoniobacterales bacterium]